MAAEYVLKEGNPNVMLCERGIRTFETAYRFTLDLTAVPVLKELTHLPVIVDPSHAAGRRDAGRAAVAGRRGGGRRRDHRRGAPGARRGDLRRAAAAARRRASPSTPRRSSAPPRWPARCSSNQPPREDRRRRRRADRRLGRARRARAARRARSSGCDPAAGALRRGARARRDRPRRAARRPPPLDGAEAAFVAAPVGALPGGGRAPRCAAAGEDCVVTDVGSTKRAVVEAVDDERFIGGHPLAGARDGGRRATPAPTLFEGATWYLTPTPRDRAARCYERLHRLLAGLGARPAALDAETHDRVLAVGLAPPARAGQRARRPGRARAVDEGERLPATGPSFRDIDARGGRQHGDLARHLPRQRRRARAAPSTTRWPA